MDFQTKQTIYWDLVLDAFRFPVEMVIHFNETVFNGNKIGSH